MSIRVLKEAAGGAAYCYQNALEPDGTTREWFFIARVRRDSKTTYLYNPHTDAVTSIPRSDTNADHRGVEALIVAGKVTPVAKDDDRPLDPLQTAREDGVAGIPVVIPQDTAGRNALRATLKTAHVDRRPAGTRFQRRVGSLIEVHEDVAGDGVTVMRERYDVDAGGRLNRRP